MAQECSVCAEVKSTEQFPASPITQECTHAPTTCRPCITRAIETELSSKPWEKVGCPDCGATLGYHDVQKYADLETREKYDKLMILHTLQQDPDFIWCSSGCGSGQLHDSGESEPIVKCTSCGHLTCFQHKVPWHAGVTCEEFDLTRSDSAASLPQGNRAVELAEARRHKRDNDASEETIRSTTKACPSCKSQIEKNGGW
ncbi:uncharacterized protein TRIREDRAFT_70837 [Trichoderma reesei QM6a]|uniref:RBR-type E3 ubiquitin transferase n=2 Tax=Hypocrea jecorina TaxID=51453 RepID=G0RX94_HYPJQ|nr:uncharacterized protein TRIREDRAFT_70837 [Trichoderma reesei QM6a]EGR44209.1 predicted protein [Trichoderma reesei QM6a]ETR96831.1 ring finger protein [Trichoderma reesei RUT C-30]